jgi:ATP-dependent exoDNAse (exonuclease V) beta subunit
MNCARSSDVVYLTQEVYNHAGLVQALESNYRSTPQILAVAEAVLKDCKDIMPKKLVPTKRADNQPPVRLWNVGDEEDEAECIAKVVGLNLSMPLGGPVVQEVFQAPPIRLA